MMLLKHIKWLKNKDYSEQQIMLCGDSAGGHLAASLTNYLIGKKELPYSQILIYPMVMSFSRI